MYDLHRVSQSRITTVNFSVTEKYKKRGTHRKAIFEPKVRECLVVKFHNLICFFPLYNFKFEMTLKSNK